MEMNTDTFSSGQLVFFSIYRAFRFLENEEYTGSEFFIGREIFITFENKRHRQTVHVCLSESNEHGKLWNVEIERKRYIFSKTFSLSEYLDSHTKGKNTFEQLHIYSEYMQRCLLPMVRGEKWLGIAKNDYYPSNNCIVSSYYISRKESLFWILYETFGFLQYEGYYPREFGIENHLFIAYENPRIKQSVTISEDCGDWCIIIQSSQSLSVNDYIREQSLNGIVDSIEAYSKYLKRHFLPVIRGEQEIKDFLKENGYTSKKK